MGSRYRQFGIEERCEIARLSGEGRSIRQIAAALDRAPSSVARELKRNSGRQVGYQATYAEEQARARRWSGSKLDRDEGLRDGVLAHLAAGWSPEQIAGRMRREGTAARIGVETIYRFIYAQITRHNDFRWRHYLPRGKARQGAAWLAWPQGRQSCVAYGRTGWPGRATGGGGGSTKPRPLGGRPHGLLPLRPEHPDAA
jgi:IS30 family transposase